ncbi:MAG: hypothetical protein ACP5UN_02280 [Candidatus Micrarchaeia archaeon]
MSSKYKTNNNNNNNNKLSILDFNKIILYKSTMFQLKQDIKNLINDNSLIQKLNKKIEENEININEKIKNREELRKKLDEEVKKFSKGEIESYEMLINKINSLNEELKTVQNTFTNISKISFDEEINGESNLDKLINIKEEIKKDAIFYKILFLLNNLLLSTPGNNLKNNKYSDKTNNLDDFLNKILEQNNEEDTDKLKVFKSEESTNNILSIFKDLEKEMDDIAKSAIDKKISKEFMDRIKSNYTVKSLHNINPSKLKEEAYSYINSNKIDLSEIIKDLNKKMLDSENLKKLNELFGIKEGSNKFYIMVDKIVVSIDKNTNLELKMNDDDPSKIDEMHINLNEIKYFSFHYYNENANSIDKKLKEIIENTKNDYLNKKYHEILNNSKKKDALDEQERILKGTYEIIKEFGNIIVDLTSKEKDIIEKHIYYEGIKDNAEDQINVEDIENLNKEINALKNENDGFKTYISNYEDYINAIKKIFNNMIDNVRDNSDESNNKKINTNLDTINNISNKINATLEKINKSDINNLNDSFIQDFKEIQAMLKQNQYNKIITYLLYNIKNAGGNIKDYYLK